MSEELLKKAGREFARVVNHQIICTISDAFTCIVCGDLDDDHNKCRQRACNAQRKMERKK